MPPCNQCGKPAVVNVAGNPLCVKCYALFENARRERDIAFKERYNQIIGEAEALTGMYGVVPRIPVSRPVVYSGPMNFSNVKVDRSVVGVINTGAIGEIDVALNRIKVSGAADLETALEQFTEAVANTQSLPNDRKNEVLEQLAFLTNQAASPKESQSRGVMKALLSGIGTAVATVSDLDALWNKVRGLFGL